VRGVLDTGSLGTAESSMAKVAVSEALMRVADRCVQVMGGTGVSTETIVEQAFREIRAFRIYDGPTEVHKWSLAKKIKRDWKAGSIKQQIQLRVSGRRRVFGDDPPGGLIRIRVVPPAFGCSISKAFVFRTRSLNLREP
jgi:hypothetical protein